MTSKRSWIAMGLPGSILPQVKEIVRMELGFIANAPIKDLAAQEKLEARFDNAFGTELRAPPNYVARYENDLERQIARLADGTKGRIGIAGGLKSRQDEVVVTVLDGDAVAVVQRPDGRRERLEGVADVAAERDCRASDATQWSIGVNRRPRCRPRSGRPSPGRCDR